MKQKTFYTSLFLGVNMIFSCSLLQDESEKLSMKLVPNETGRLRLNGYYYTERIAYSDTFRTILYMYQNGLILELGAFPKMTFSEIDKMLTDSVAVAKLFQYHFNFGHYRISGDSIYMQRFTRRGHSIVVYNSRGTIPNNSTFELTEDEFVKSGSSMNYFVQHYFRPYPSKPDSSLYKFE